MSSVVRKSALLPGFAALLLLAALAFFIIWRPAADDDPAPPQGELHQAAPAPRFASLLDAPAETTLQVDLNPEGPRWQTASGDVLLRAPILLHGQPWSWKQTTIDGWRLAHGQSQGEGVEVTARIWTDTNLGAAIIDIDAQIIGDRRAAPLYVVTTIHESAAAALTADLQELSLPGPTPSTSLFALRADGSEIPLQLFSPAQARGRVLENRDDDSIDIAWTLWSGNEIPQPCLLDADQTSRSSLRLILQFGPRPAFIPAPFPTTNRAVATAVYFDPQSRSENAWADGRARDAEEFARRVRALSFGHSDPDDPRYGNGGLLASRLGATVAVPIAWWDQPSIGKLRQALSETAVELIPQGVGAADDDDRFTTRLLDHSLCDPNHDGVDHGQTLQLILQNQSSNPAELALADPIPRILTTGKASPQRRHLLRRVFDPEQADSLFAPDTYRTLAIPLIATRNPLEPVAEQAILAPDRAGHWTLDDSLTRALSLWELESRSDDFGTISLGDLFAHRERHRSALAFLSPAGDLEFHPDDEPLHFLLFQAETPLRSWLSAQQESPPSAETSPPLDIEFILP